MVTFPARSSNYIHVKAASQIMCWPAFVPKIIIKVDFEGEGNIDLQTQQNNSMSTLEEKHV